MSDQIYHDLRERIDQYSIGFNATEDQKEITLLKTLFTEEHARMYMHLKHALEPVEKIAERAGMGVESAADILSQMTGEGLTFPRTKNEKKYYAAAPFIHGLFEHYVLTHDPKDPGFAEVSRQMRGYMEGGFFPKGLSMRTIPIDVGVDPNQKKSVQPFENVKKIIESKEKICLGPCVCHVHAKALGDPCEQTRDVCMGFDYYAEYVVEEYGAGRWITQEEALAIIKQCEEEGLVHQIAGDGNSVEAICNCCADCCGVLRLAKAFPTPGDLVMSNFHVNLDADYCVNCEACMDRCPVGAFSQGEESVKLDVQRCIGCGLCTTTCAGEALSLVAKPENQRHGVLPPSALSGKS